MTAETAIIGPRRTVSNRAVAAGVTSIASTRTLPTVCNEMTIVSDRSNKKS